MTIGKDFTNLEQREFDLIRRKKLRKYEKISTKTESEYERFPHCMMKFVKRRQANEKKKKTIT